MQIELTEGETIVKDIIEELISEVGTKLSPFQYAGYVPNPSSFSDSGTEISNEKFIEVIKTLPLKSQSLILEGKDGKGLIKRVSGATIVSSKKQIVLNHIKIADQHVYNLCGYHNAHTMVFLTKMFKLGTLRCSDYVQREAIDHLIQETSRRINCSVSFWQFHINLTRFLVEYAKKARKDVRSYPWKKTDCLYGDYERVYHQVFLNHLPLYQEVYASYTKEFKIHHCKLQLQFGKFITDFSETQDIQDQIDEFRSSNGPRRKLFLLKVAVTNHWVGFSIFKIEDQIIFLYFDSRDEDNLGWSLAQIEESVRKEDERRRATNHPRIWNDFKKLCHIKSREDIQTICKLIPRVFMGSKSLFDHNFEGHFISTYELNWRKDLLFPLAKMRGELEVGSDILGFLFENFGELKSFVREFAYFFHLLDYLSEKNLRLLFVIFLECRGVLDRCLKYLKKVRYGKSREVFKNWLHVKKIGEGKKWIRKMNEWGIMASIK